MKRFGAVLALYVVAVTLPARAASPRTFVSFAGVDSNPCSRPAPCRSFSAALAQTMAGGVIVVLDSAGYGPVTIGQSVSLIAPDGVYAGITATSGNGVTLYGTTSSDIVILRGLSIEGTGTANFGVQLLASTDIKQLHVQRCAFRGFVFAGIQFYASGVLIVSDTFMNPSGTGIDVFAAPNAFQPRAFIDHCRVVGGGNAYHIDGATVTITNSVAAENLNSGISVQTSPANVTVDGCEIVGNGIVGITSTNNAVVRVANTTITDNGFGISYASGGSVLSMIGDSTFTVKSNVVKNNTNNLGFTGTFVAH